MSDTYGSDDQSIDDQRDTATGGLVNDTPSLPTQPPSSPGVRPPTALGGMAHQLFQGAPAPRPAGPGRSPYQFPGQSQAPVGGPQSTQNASRWQGTTASLALPKGSMQPQANFSPYIPGPKTTNYKQWGQVEPFPELPQSFELPGIYGNLANFFGNTGSPIVSALALSMGKNGSAFLDSIMKGQEWKAKMHRQQMEDDARQLELLQGREISDYYNVVDQYETASGAKTADAVGNYAINGMTMMDALANKAIQNGDDQLLGVLSTGSAEKTLDFVHRRNDNWQTLSKANQKADEQAQQDAATFGETAPGEGQTQEQGRGAKFEGAHPAASYYGQTPTSAAPGQPPPRPTQTSGDPAPPQQEGGFDWGREANNPGMQEMIKDEATGRGDAKEIKGPMGPYIMKRAADLNGWVKTKLANDPSVKADWIDAQGNIHSPTADALKAAGLDQMASDASGVAYYNQAFGGGQSGGGGGGGPEQNYNATVKMLVKKMRPFNPETGDSGWVQHFYEDRQKFMESQQNQNTVARVRTVSETGDEVFAATQDLPPEYSDPVSFQKAFREAYDQGTGNEQVVRLANAWHRYQSEVNVLIRGGQGGITETMQNDAVVPTYLGSPTAYRSVIIQDARIAKSRLSAMHDNWDKMGGGNMPMVGKQSEKELDLIANTEPVHMAAPGQVIPGSEWPDGKARRWLGPYVTDPKDPRHGELRTNPMDWWEMAQ